MRRSRAWRRAAHLALPILALVGIVALTWRFLSPRAVVLTLAIGMILALLVASVLILPVRLIARDAAGSDLTPEQRISAINSVRTTLVQGVIGLTALAGIFVGWQQLQADRDQARADQRNLRDQLILTRQGQVAERLARAADQLGSDKLDVRLGGIYALQQIAEESEDRYRLVAFDLVVTFLQEHSPRRGSSSVQAVRGKAIEAVKRPSPDVQAAASVLVRRDLSKGDPALDLGSVDLSGLDLSHAQLLEARFSSTSLDNADLSGADLQRATFSWTTLNGVDLDEANLQGAVFDYARLEYGRLQRANMREAKLLSAILRYADLEGANLRGADLSSVFSSQLAPNGQPYAGADLRNANLTGADLRDANLRGVDLREATLSAANLLGARLEGIKLEKAKADSRTTWPAGFDWRTAGVQVR